jgi:colicin import membrane protein
VFRNVDLGGRSAEVQPIDLRVLRHDRRELRAVEADRTCRVMSGQLTCRRPVIADSYTLWIVPESIAERAGAMALETAVRSDSFYEHSASLNR